MCVKSLPSSSSPLLKSDMLASSSSSSLLSALVGACQTKARPPPPSHSSSCSTSYFYRWRGSPALRWPPACFHCWKHLSILSGFASSFLRLVPSEPSYTVTDTSVLPVTPHLVNVSRFSKATVRCGDGNISVGALLKILASASSVLNEWLTSYCSNSR